MSYLNLNETSLTIPQPSDLNIELMEHQKRSVYAMINLEKNGCVEVKNLLFFGNENKDLMITTKIGILGDIVGAGKSLIVVCLCLLEKQVKEQEMFYSSDKYINIKRVLSNHIFKQTNLIIVPDHLDTQWINFFTYAPTLNVQIYEKTKIYIQNFDDINTIIVKSSNLGDFLNLYNNVIWNRIVIDEADSIKIQDYELFANFIWLVTGTPSGIGVSKSKYIKNIFGKNINWITDAITIKNNIEYLKISLNLPPLKRIVINCHTPVELKILKEFIPNSIIQMINAGNSDDAIKALNCHIDTKDNIFVVIKKAIENNIHNKLLEIEIEKKKKLSGFKYDESVQKVEKIEKAIKNLQSRLKAIQTKIKESDEQICPVCMGETEQSENPVLLNCCGTTFCLECLAFTSKNKTTCPYCLSKVDKKSMHIITHDSSNKKHKQKITKLKNKVDALLEIIETSTGGVLVFANFLETFEKIKSVLQLNKISYDILKGNAINKTIEKFNSGKIKVLMLNASYFGAGLNLQQASDIVIYHRFTNETEEQVIGRSQRIGRTTNLNVYYLIHENETNCFTQTFDVQNIDIDAEIDNLYVE
jgi:RNA polymerase subunit RPABC4/transcription elongation factor Spt4